MKINNKYITKLLEINFELQEQQGTHQTGKQYFILTRIHHFVCLLWTKLTRISKYFKRSYKRKDCYFKLELQV